MKERKFIYIVYGEGAKDLSLSISTKLCTCERVYDSPRLLVFESQNYDTGLPQKPVDHDSVTLHFHGIIFPKQCSIDYLASNRESVVKEMIAQNRDDLSKVPFSLANGSYVGLAVDHKQDQLIAFTSFLNSIPFYYAQCQGCIILCTDLEILAKSLSFKYELNEGILEYYANGTNLSDNTAFPEIKCIPKGGLLEYSKGVSHISFYYKMPTEESNHSFRDHVDQFAELWDNTLRSVHSNAYKYGLGFTGGLDSRLILAAMPDRNVPLLFTGSHPDHSDVVLAKHITDGLGLSNHVMEDYRKSNKLEGYVKYSAMADNPFHCNSLYFHDQMQFREKHGLVYEFNGLTEFLGGVYHYSDRRSISNTIKMALPPTEKRLSLSTETKLRLLSLGLRNNDLSQDFRDFAKEALDSHIATQIHSFDTFYEQIGQVRTEEKYLERFRHFHKMANLLAWAVLPGRRYNEHLSPSMNIDMTDFACRVPLSQRDSRRLILAYLRIYKPELAKFVISGYFLSADSPWLIYKLLSPHVKVINHLGYKIPRLQWYIKKHKYKTLSTDARVYAFQEAVCRDSDVIMKSAFRQILENKSSDRNRLMRMYNIALFEKKMQMSEGDLLSYLLEIHGFKKLVH
ncbi:MAG: hypothetical protein PHE01_00880 [Methanosarcina sp.]|jgi:hypothetical protein|nr:hypothetical protein [Methanosarcina sp.]MDD4401612.1 hypothetical protein [Desulfitobacteriaceae bacterium]